MQPLDQNPFQPPSSDGQREQETPSAVSSSQTAYNVVSDTVVGVNLRCRDNRLQALFILASTAVGALAGTILVTMNSSAQVPWYAGALAGSLGGLILGTFASGIFLMIYRAVRHLKGRHD